MREAPLGDRSIRVGDRSIRARHIPFRSPAGPGAAANEHAELGYGATMPGLSITGVVERPCKELAGCRAVCGAQIRLIDHFCEPGSLFGRVLGAPVGHPRVLV